MPIEEYEGMLEELEELEDIRAYDEAKAALESGEDDVIPLSPASGDHRVIYEVDDGRRTITILQVGHRRDVYRQG